jgi:hypothetical protein
MFLKLHASKGFCEDVGGVDDTQSVKDFELSILNVRANKMISYVDVFGTSMRRVIGGQRKCTVVVSGDDEG